MSVKNIIKVTNRGLSPVLSITQGTDAVKFEFTISDYNIPSGSSAVAYNIQPTGNIVNQLCSISGNTISITPRAYFFLRGKNYMQFQITNNKKNLFSFLIEVWCSPNISEPEVSEVQDPTVVTQVLSKLGEIDLKIDSVDTRLGNRINNIVANNNPTEGNTELIDIRSGYDGTTYPSAGEAVRKQIGSLSEEIDEKAYYRGSLEGITSLATVTDSGIYNITASNALNITDLPSNFPKTDSSFEVKRGYSGNYVEQIIYSTNTHLTPYQRVVKISDNSVYKDWETLSDVIESVKDCREYLDYITDSDYYADVNAIITEKAYGHDDGSFVTILKNTYSNNYNVYEIPVNNYPFKLKVSGTTQGESTYLIYTAGENYEFIERYIGGSTEYNTVSDYKLEIKNKEVKKCIVTVRTDYNYEILINDRRYANCYSSEEDKFQNKRLDAVELAVKTKPWFGKSVCCFGDSTTYGDNGLGNGTASTSISWVAHLSELCGFSMVTNKGMNGSHVAVKSSRKDSFVERLSQLTKHDLFIVMGGLNDFLFGSPLGSLGNGDTSTFYGALEAVVNYIITNFPESQLVVFTPMKVNHAKSSDGSSYGNTFSPNSQGLCEADYVKAVKEICDKYSVRVKDMYTESGISPFNENQKTLYMGDGLHYLAIGYERLAKTAIAPFINNCIAPD